MQDPYNLRVTQQARVVAKLVYEATKRFPSAERFGLTGQMRRAAISIGSNICEGCGRHGDGELVRFLQIALGSATELEFQLTVARDLEFLSDTDASGVLGEVTRVKKMLACLITAIRRGGARANA